MSAPDLYMQRCLELASNGLGRVAPNPMVGCVIVHDGKIIGEGFHHAFGEAHAEVVAINEAVERHDESVLKNSELYVSLEPCAHHGKTPPCADLIIEKKIAKVTVGCTDPFQEVNGAGIRKLTEAGINVTTGVMEQEARDLNKRFFTFHQKKRPYIILKWAQSADQFIAPIKQTEFNRWISNTFSRKLVHKWRSEEQAILVGSKTVHVDNPSLTVREWKGKNPLRVVLDPLDTLHGDLRILGPEAPTLVFTEKKSGQTGSTEWLKADFTKNTLPAVLDELVRRNIQSVIVEGGALTLQSFIDEKLWDEARIFAADKFLNDGVKAPKIDFSKLHREELILNDKLYTLVNS